jgi:hypothetical protein
LLILLCASVWVQPSLLPIISSRIIAMIWGGTQTFCH